MTTLKELAKLAIEVQDACNLSGVVHAFSRAMSDLREIMPNADTAAINRHPITKLWVAKLYDLCGFGLSDHEVFRDAYHTCHEIGGIRMPDSETYEHLLKEPEEPELEDVLNKVEMDVNQIPDGGPTREDMYPVEETGDIAEANQLKDKLALHEVTWADVTDTDPESIDPPTEIEIEMVRKYLKGMDERPCVPAIYSRGGFQFTVMTRRDNVADVNHIQSTMDCEFVRWVNEPTIPTKDPSNRFCTNCGKRTVRFIEQCEDPEKSAWTCDNCQVIIYIVK